METADQLDVLFHALADRTRRDMVQRLSVEPGTVNGLAQCYDMSLPAVRKHLKVLERAGLVLVNKQGRVHHCNFDGKNLDLVSQEINKYKQFWTARFDEMDEYLAAMEKKEK